MCLLFFVLYGVFLIRVSDDVFFLRMFYFVNDWFYVYEECYINFDVVLGVVIVVFDEFSVNEWFV